jgi:selenocysteine lyase/cysteine desulfurase
MRKVGALVVREREFDDAMLRRTRRPPDSTVPLADEHETRLGTVIARKYHPSSDRTNNQDPTMNRQHPVNFDNNSTTPLDPRAVQAMVPYFSDRFGNAASRSHKLGWIAQEAVDHARMQVAN